MLVFEYGFGTRQRRFRHRLPPCEPIGFAKAIVLLFAHRHNPPRPRRENCHRPAHAPAAWEPALGRDPRDDLLGLVLAQEPWETVRFPWIASRVVLHCETARRAPLGVI